MDPDIRELTPPPALQASVETIWLRRPPGVPVPVTILPNGCMDLIYRYATGKDGSIGDGQLLLTGPDWAARSFVPAAGYEYLGVRFRPAEARPLLGVDPRPLLDAGAVPGCAAAPLVALERQLGYCGSRLALMENMVAELGAMVSESVHLRPPHRVRRAIAALRKPHRRVDHLAVSLGVTPRTLHRELVTWTGQPPKHLARVFRLHSAVRAIRASELGLAHLAQMAGYADQAHMAREFRELAAAPPSSFR